MELLSSEFLMLILAVLLFFLGIIGAIVPILPGPLFSYLGLFIIHDCIGFSHKNLIWYAILTIVIFLLDYFAQFFGVKKFGGGTYSTLGTFFGIILGLLFSPTIISVILFPFLGAFLGALMDNRQEDQALKIAFGSLLGFLFGSLVKLIFAIYLIKVTWINWNWELC